MWLVGTVVTMTMVVVAMRSVCMRVVRMTVVRVDLRLGIGMRAVMVSMGIVRMGVAEALLAVEGQEQQAEAVEAGD